MVKIIVPQFAKICKGGMPPQARTRAFFLTPNRQIRPVLSR